MVIATHFSVQNIVWSNMVNQFCLGGQHYFRGKALSVKAKCLTEFLVGHNAGVTSRDILTFLHKIKTVWILVWIIELYQKCKSGGGAERIILKQIFSDADPEFLELGIWLSLGIACNVFHINAEIRSHVPAPPLGLANVFQWFLWSIQWLLIWKL